MKSCLICDREITNTTYIVLLYPDRCICEQCLKQLTVCTDDMENEKTQLAQDSSADCTESKKDENALHVLSSNKSCLRKDDLIMNKRKSVSAQGGFAKADIDGSVLRIGVEIKGITKSVFWIGTALALAIGMMLTVQGRSTRSVGLALLLAGPFLACLISLLLYVLGTLIEKKEMSNTFEMDLKNQQK